ncbi:hypothetical protein TNCV_1021571 [Trichonephila clavipes]|uniref:Uncharacterized protein n=1 Tax=Trichonephila clavipes TaxID=2585209 RepID=A0A8X6VDH7_TRICX|nr:hypothetical protein TNCV_1021571 [Trichonephila clavipes]
MVQNYETHITALGQPVGCEIAYPPSKPKVAATGGRLATDLVIFNHGQETRMTLEVAPLYPKFHSKPRKDV